MLKFFERHYMSIYIWAVGAIYATAGWWNLWGISMCAVAVLALFMLERKERNIEEKTLARFEKSIGVFMFPVLTFGMIVMTAMDRTTHGLTAMAMWCLIVVLVAITVAFFVWIRKAKID